MKARLQYIFNSGIHDGMPYPLQRRIVITNLLGFTMVFSTLFIAMVFTFFIERDIIVIGSVISAVIFGMVPWLNHKGHYTISRLVLGIYYPVVIFVLSMWGKMLEPEALEINQYYIPRILFMSAFCAPFVLFELREWKWMLVMIVIVASFLLGFDLWLDMLGLGFMENMGQIDLTTYPHINLIFFVSTIMIALAFFYLVRVNDQYEQRILNLFEEVKDKEQSLSEAYGSLKQSEDVLKKEIVVRKQVEVDLIEAKERAEKSAMAKAEFLSNMSHELRTPLNAVIGIANLMEDEHLKGEQKENFNILSFSAENLMNIINDVLDFSKIETGKMELENIDFSIHELVQRIVQSLQIKADERRVVVDIEMDENITSRLIGDPVRLSQVFTNLLSNAIKFTEAGNVKVIVKLNQVEKGMAHLYVAVEDTGIGIPEDKQQLIFESFSQANPGTTRQYGGTGLGLAITKKLLEIFGTQLQLKSEVGKGSCFFFNIELPISAVEEQATTDTIITDDFTGLEGKKVLLVEDNILNQKIAVRFLEKWGMEVSLVDDGLKAYEEAQANDYGLILMDLQMPQMDGYEASRKIRTLGGVYADIPIIALTASAMMEIRQRAYDAGMNDYISKPFNPKELFRKIAKLMVEV